MALPKVKVGDRLVFAAGNRMRGDEVVEVSRVGRDWLYVAQDGKELRARFDRRSGRQDYNGAAGHLYTQEQYDERKLRTSLLHQLLAAGVEIRREERSSITTVTLRRLLEVMQSAD